MDSSPLSIFLFGPFEVRLRGRTMRRLRSRSVEWLLGFLVLRNGRAVSRPALAGTLWPESSYERALHNLRISLAELRRALGPEAERVHAPTRDTLLLELTGAAVDLLAFDAAVAAGEESALLEAISLYRGPLLEGCSELWIFGEREARREACLQALEKLADLALAGGDTAAALGHLLRAETLDPLRDRVQQRRMQALASSGDLPAALLSYREYRLRLHREMNLEPDPETTRLFHELRSGRGGAGAGRPLSPRQDLSPVPPGVLAPTPGAGPAPSLREAPAENGPHSLPEPRPPARPPRPLTPLIGREEELQEVTSLVTASPLVTLVGGGGVGKTRLALQVAAGLEAQFPERILFVELASLADPALLPSFVAAALGLLEGARPDTVSPMQTLTGWLSPQPTLLVLDNCEHLIQAAAELTQALLTTCPRLHLVTTSRQRLGLTGEIAWRVPSLPGPDPEQLPADAPGAVGYALQFPAARLFLERAAAVRPGFRLRDREEARALAQLCQRLDGIPLALELAAARVTVLNVSQIAARLDDRFQLLTGGSRAALPRHQTLRALIDWSYDGLPDEEAALLRRLSVFAGGWTLEAAESIAGSDGATSGVIDLLSSLEGRSLVLVEEAGEARFDAAGVSSGGRAPGQGLRCRMLETVREYAREKLQECGEEAVARDAHGAYFLALAEAAEAGMRGAEAVRWLSRLEADHGNLRAALAWGLESPGGWGVGLRLACALVPFWVKAYNVDEGRRYLEAFLASPQAAGRSAARAAALDGAGTLAVARLDFGAVRAYADESLAICEERGDRRGMARALYLLSRRIDPLTEMRRLAERSLVLFRECNDPAGVADALMRLSELASTVLEYAAARTFQSEALAIARSIGDRTLEAECLRGLGWIEYVAQSDDAAAEGYYRDSLALARELGWHGQVAVALFFLGYLAFRQRDYPAARVLWEECREIDQRNRNKGGSVVGALAELAAVEGDYATARTLWEEFLAEGRELGWLGLVAGSLQGLGDTARLAGDVSGALTRYRESLQAVQASAGHPEQKISDEGQRLLCTACLRGIAAILSQCGREVQAVRLLGAVAALPQPHPAAVSTAAQAADRNLIPALHQALGEEAFAAAWAEGGAMSAEQALEYASAAAIV